MFIGSRFTNVGKERLSGSHFHFGAQNVTSNTIHLYIGHKKGARKTVDHRAQAFRKLPRWGRGHCNGDGFQCRPVSARNGCAKPRHPIISTTTTVAVFGLNHVPFTKDGFTALPPPPGTDYRVMSYPMRESLRERNSPVVADCRQY